MNPIAPEKQIRYVVITPARDEAKYITETIKSVARQTIRPVQWIIVDDGSTDQTGEIIDRFARNYSWVSTCHMPNRGARQNAGGVMEAFYHGYHSLKVPHWDFLAKLDGDLSFDSTYFAKCLEEFQADPALGIGGGLIWNAENGASEPEKCPSNHVRGATKIYRRECWDGIGGLLRSPGWDTVDELKAMMLGWHVRTFRDLKVLHYRPTGAAEGAWRNSLKDGRADYISGYHPLFMFLKCIKRLAKKPYVVGSLGLLCGYLSSYFRRIPQVNDSALITFVRRQQIRRILFLESIWK